MTVPGSRFAYLEATIGELQDQMAAGRLTARRLTDAYLRRIRALDQAGPALNSVIELNPDAGAIAAELDDERERGTTRGPLHGIPVLVKDNIATGDAMQTTAGSLALLGHRCPRDAQLVSMLRDAGAVLVGKTNLSEWANIRDRHSTSGWSGRGGLTRNPYVLDRNPSGSSSGSGAAIAANLAMVAVGTETDGSIVAPSSANGLVGLKPTVGLVSRDGVIPISHTQDTAGPMTRTVADAAALLGALAGPDERDPITLTVPAGGRHGDYRRFLDPSALAGKRLGVVRPGFAGAPGVRMVYAGALEALSEGGATLVDPVPTPTERLLAKPEMSVLLHELKAGLQAWLGTFAPGAAVASLRDVIEWNIAHASEELAWFAQETFERAQACGPLTAQRYRRALAACGRLARDEGIDAVLAAHELDALVAPTASPAWVTDLVNGDHASGATFSSLPAVAGYPHLTVPAGVVHGLPVGLSFVGPAWSEPLLLALGYAFEQLTGARRAPRFLPTLR